MNLRTAAVILSAAIAATAFARQSSTVAPSIPTPDARTPGLQLYVYDVGPIRRLQNLVPGQTPNVSMVVAAPDLKGLAAFGLTGELQNDFLAILTGYLQVDTAGEYEFELSSDDGSDFTLAGQTVIDHDGLHDANVTKKGSINLQPGAHPLRLRMFDAYVDEQLTLKWKPPGATGFTPVPTTAVFTQANVVQVTSPGRKNLIPVLTNLRPGDGMPLAAVHPAFTVTQIHRPGFEPKVGGIDFLPDGRMVVCAWEPEGGVYIVTNPSGKPSDMKISQFAKGLAEPLGIKVVNGEIYVLQFHELTKLVDTNKDGLADEFRSVCNSWPATSNFHEFAFGLVYRDGFFYANLAVAINPGGENTVPQAAERGSTIRIDPKTGTHEIVASGLRTPNGIGLLSDNSIWITDNQGDWLPSSTLMKLVPGAFYGAHKTPDHPAASQPETPPVAWLPQGEIGNSPSQPTDLRVGPWKGQILHGDVTHGGLKRTFVESVMKDGREVLNGCVFRFSQGLNGGINRAVWEPDGALYVGAVGSTGNWGQEGKQWFGLERLNYTPTEVFEPLAVRVKANGVEIEFTQPLSPSASTEPSNFLLRQWRYQRTADYGGGKLDDTALSVASASLSPDRRRLFLETPGLLENHVVYLRLPHSLRDAADRPLWTTEAWYTLNALPAEKSPTAPPPPQNTLSPEESAAGWKLLFDGEKAAFRGFGRPTLPEGWRAENGALTRLAGAGDIVSNDEFSDFELSLDWKVAPGGNSGIFYRVAEDGGSVWETGPEMQVLDNQRHPDGREPATSAGSLYALYAPNRDASFGPDRWNTVRIVARGTRVQHWLNGEKVVEYDSASDDFKARVAASKFRDLPRFAKLPAGRIALQDHGDKVAYRNIKIRSLK